MQYSTILKTAYQTTINHPSLWFFGLFLLSGPNLLFLYFQHNLGGVSTTITPSGFSFNSLEDLRAGVMLLLIGLGILMAVVMSWVKILLVLHSVYFLKLPRVKLGLRRASDAQVTPADTLPSYWGFVPVLLKESQRYVVRVLLLNIVAWVLLAGGLFLLLVPVVATSGDPARQSSLAALAFLLGIPLVFVISTQNIFAIFVAVLYQKSVRTALALAWDLLVIKWPAIVMLTLVLLFIYGMVFFAGFSVAGSIASLVRLVPQLLGAPGVDAILLLTTLAAVVRTVFFVILVAGVNVFFNVALLLLFYELMPPLLLHHVAKETEPELAASAVPPL
jgi:hypothetical protein